MYHHCGPCRSCPARRLLEFLGCRSGIGAYPLILSWPHKHTVDGRNPAPAHVVSIPLFTGFCTSQVVQDFFHQQYEINSYKHIEMANSNVQTLYLEGPSESFQPMTFYFAPLDWRTYAKWKTSWDTWVFPKTKIGSFWVLQKTVGTEHAWNTMLSDLFHDTKGVAANVVCICIWYNIYLYIHTQ